MSRVAIVGCTGSGKSSLAHVVARNLGDVEIISVDSMSVYRGMSIATAKASLHEQSEVRYHLIDVVDPWEEFTVAQFQSAARVAVREIEARGAGVLYVGGTGLYGRAVIDDFDIPAQFPDIRAELEARVPDELPQLYAELVGADPLAASRMEATNARRIVRALEVFRGSGRPFSSFGPGVAHYATSPIAQVGLEADFEKLDAVLESRFRSWMNEGLVEEVRSLRASGHPLSRTAALAVGYRQIIDFLEGKISEKEAVDLAIIATKQLARRQRAWFRRDPRIEWFVHGDDATARIVELLEAS